MPEGASLPYPENSFIRMEQTNASANQIELALAPGQTAGNARQFIIFTAKYAKPADLGIQVKCAPIADEYRQLRNADGTQVSNGAWVAKQDVIIAYNLDDGPTPGLYRLIMPGKPAPAPSWFIPLEHGIGSTANALVLAPVAGVAMPNNTGARVRFKVQLNANQTASMTIIIAGINDVDALQLRLSDQASQVPGNTFLAGQLIEFERTPDGHYHLVTDPVAAATGGAASKYQTALTRSAGSNAARALTLARKALAV